MRRFVRVEDDRVIDTSKEPANLGYGKSKWIMKDAELFIEHYENQLYTSLGKVENQSDNPLALVKIGDCLEYKVFGDLDYYRVEDYEVENFRKGSLQGLDIKAVWFKSADTMKRVELE